jgi:diacylglycerol kinase family enzyme
MGVGFDAAEPAAPGELERRVREGLREGYRTIAVVGGDGTLSEAARGFFQSPDELQTVEASLEGDTPAHPSSNTPAHRSGDALALPVNVAPRAALAILPAGTGDDFARGLRGQRAPLAEWIERLVAHCRRAGDGRETERAEETATPRVVAQATTTRVVDVLYATVNNGARKFVCLNAATLGIGAEVATRVGAQGGALRRLPGEVRFALAASGALVAWRNRAVRIEVDDDDRLECETNLIAVANGPFAGGGMHFAPEARSDDAQLDLLTVCGISRAGVVRELARIHRGGHLANPKVSLQRGASVRIETLDAADPLPVEADGDVRGHTPATFQIIPRALRIVW